MHLDDASIGGLFVLYIIASFILAFIPAHIAREKGRTHWKWYFYSLFLFVIAFIHAIAVKPNQNELDRT